ncbi:hypothetical protein EUX98_g7690 [Antrodiella citrinella]|uniref:Uncharacterized protein n=1 Tax=Antrodiella citrinella TaxID=2447956 RepID=A0A4S4MMS0_9APHY|nr:hypothetical protein EUX98_g7690 [Antrodiella citrinella]
MVEQIGVANYKAEDAEQSFLNHFYGAEAIRLPYAYNGNQAIKKRSPKVWAGIAKELRVVHYTMVKPFLARDYAEVKLKDMDQHTLKQTKLKGGIYEEEVLWWRDMWQDARRTYGDQLDRCQIPSLRR